MAVDILSFDFSATMIGCSLSALVIFISYLIYKVGIAEKSFEEVIEEQKKRTIEEEIQQKLEKGKKEKKFKKTWGKKSKEKVDQEVTPESVHVEEKIMPHIEIIEPKERKSPKQKKVKVTGSSNASHQTESNIVEKSKNVEVGAVPEKHVQEKKKEEVVVVKENEKVKAELKQADVLKTKVEIIENATSIPVQTAVPNGPSKKKKKEQVEKDAIPLTTSKLLSLIKDTELDTEEIQNLIDILLNKQKDSTGWTKKNDQLALTKRNLQEKEQLLEQEQRQNKDVTSKLKDLREEHNLLKAKLTNQEKANQEKISRQHQEIQALTLRLKQFQEQLSAEKEKYNQIQKESDEKIEATLNSAEEEKAKLQQKIMQLETETRSAVSKTEIESLKKSRDDLQKVHALVVEQHTQLVSTHKTDVKNLTAQLNDAKAKLEEVNEKNVVLLQDVQALSDAKATFDVAKRTMEEKLLIAEKHSADLENQVKDLSARCKEFIQLQIELKDLRLENERLAEQLVSTKERVAGDGQEIVHQNGELNGKLQEEVILKSVEEKDKLLEEKETALAQLNEDLMKHKAKISVLNEEIEVQKQKNNELREKNYKAMDALANAEKKILDEQNLMQIYNENKQKDISNTSQSSALDELTVRIEKAEEESAKRLSDYNNELENNKQLTSEINRISALQKSTELRIATAEKTIQDLNSRLTKCQSNTKECLLRIFSTLSVDNSLPYADWLVEFEKQAVLAVQAASSAGNTEIEAKYHYLLEEKEKEFLEKQKYYEKVLAETESTLHNLQKSAESQEGVWLERLSLKELELKEALSQRDSLAAEKESMQSTFQQISQLEEVQEKLKLLQSTLESTESERSQLEQKYDEVHKNCLNLRDQLENKEVQISDLQKESNRVENLKQEIEDLKSSLEKEKKISKDFSTQMIRLSSLVKIGQDALAAEQEMVKKLKNQLETSQVSATNGTVPPTISSPVTNSESQPKTKSSEKSKKKMDASAKK